jgi:hypothetical protein
MPGIITCSDEPINKGRVDLSRFGDEGVVFWSHVDFVPAHRYDSSVGDQKSARFGERLQLQGLHRPHDIDVTSRAHDAILQNSPDGIFYR